jgi:hypothetical protein
MSMSTPEQKNLKAVPKATVMTDDTGQPVLFAALTGPGMPFQAEKQVCWWHKVPGQAAWTQIEYKEALKPIDKHGCFVRLDLVRLGLATNVKQVQIACSEGPEVAPVGELVCNVPHVEADIPVIVDETEPPSQAEPPKRVEVSLSRTHKPNTEDEIFYGVVRASANLLSFESYQNFMDGLFSHANFAQAASYEKRKLAEGFVGVEKLREPFPFTSVDAYRVLKIATEIFVMAHCGVMPPRKLTLDRLEEEARFGHTLPKAFDQLWKDYLVAIGRPEAPKAYILPYLDIIRRKLGDVGVARGGLSALVDQQSGLLHEKLVHPVLLELIWSYWMEEGMLVQGFSSIVRRFQNVRHNGAPDPLSNLEIDPLRPLNNLLWGWVQDEIHQLSVLRRAHEYDHHYGFTLHGKATAELRTADRRSKFLESFHNLLWRCVQFYRSDDDTTVLADGFNVLNALKETHYVLAHGAHNQFGDLPSTARQEMLMQMWLLSRPEMREFLGGRVMVPYPEPWMDRVDALKSIKGWTPTSVVHFRDLAVYGEQILLTIRWGNWSTINDPNSAANWARYWRAEIQGYIHSYRAATGVDLTADITDQRQAEQRFLPPSVHLRRMLASGAR